MSIFEIPADMTIAMGCIVAVVVMVAALHQLQRRNTFLAQVIISAALIAPTIALMNGVAVYEWDLGFALVLIVLHLLLALAWIAWTIEFIGRRRTA